MATLLTGQGEGGRVKVTVDPDVEIIGYQHERLAQKELLEQIGELEFDLREARRLGRAGGAAADDYWVEQGRIYAKLADLTQRMIVRRRRDRYDRLAEGFVLALDGLELPQIWIVCLMAGRVNSVAEWLLANDEPQFDKARQLAPGVLEAWKATGARAWPKGANG